MRWVRPAGRYLAHGVLWIGLPLALAQTIASPVMVFGLFGFEAPHKVRPSLFGYAWSYYMWHFGKQPDVQYWGMIAGGIAAIPVAALMLMLAVAMHRRQRRVVAQGDPLAVVPDAERARSNVYGKARWMEPAEAARLFRKPDPALGAIPIVEINRVDRDRTIAGKVYDSDDRSTWGKGGTAATVCDPMRPGKPSSGVIIGASGAGKTAAFTIPALHAYRGSMVINDPSGEASAVTAAWREEMGQRVAIIDPTFPALGAFNILKTIDITSNMAPIAIKAFVTEASGPSKVGMSQEDNFFKGKALQLNTALLADLLYDPGGEKTVREWRQRIITPEKEMKDRLRFIHGNSKSQYARDITGELMDTFHETSSGIRAHATGDTEWLSYAPLADLLSEDTFDPADLCGGRRTVFLQFPTETLNADPSVARVVIGSLMRTVMRAKGRVASNIPFIIDETYQLKHLAVLATARDEGRKFRCPLFTMWQSEGQIEEVWGGPNGKKPWFNSAAWRMYVGGVDDVATAKELSEACGSYTVVVPNEGSSTNAPAGVAAAGKTTRSTNAGVTLQRRMLITSDELRYTMRPDEALVLFKNQPPARFGLPLYFRRPEVLADLKPNPFLAGARQPIEASS